jgi:hypothetical protein
MHNVLWVEQDKTTSKGKKTTAKEELQEEKGK